MGYNETPLKDQETIMSQILYFALALVVIVIAKIMKISISLLIRVTAKPADIARRLDDVNRNYNKMIYGTKKLKK